MIRVSPRPAFKRCSLALIHTPGLMVSFGCVSRVIIRKYLSWLWPPTSSWFLYWSGQLISTWVECPEVCILLGLEFIIVLVVWDCGLCSRSHQRCRAKRYVLHSLRASALAPQQFECFFCYALYLFEGVRIPSYGSASTCKEPSNCASVVASFHSALARNI